MGERESGRERRGGREEGRERGRKVEERERERMNVLVCLVSSLAYAG
jgi:hypothetical protein